MKRGNRSTANRESDVKALAGVKSPPSKVKTPNEITVTKTGMLFSINELHCQEEFNKEMKSRSNAGKKYIYLQVFMINTHFLCSMLNTNISRKLNSCTLSIIIIIQHYNLYSLLFDLGYVFH